MNLDALQEMIKVYLNEVEAYDEEHYDESRAVLSDFIMYWRETWADENEDSIAY